MKEKLGVVFGRFQPLHKGHLENILIPFNECEFVYLGITNPDNHLIDYDKTDKNRSMRSSNPFTYFHRQEMIKRTLLDQKIPLNRFEIIPFPINFPELILDYSPKNALYYVADLINDNANEWNLKKVSILRNLELRTKTLRNKRITSSTEVRKRIREGSAWEELVPKPVFNYINENGLTLGVEED